MQELTNEANQIDTTEMDFDNEVFYSTYIYNKINVFVNSYDISEGVVELKSCDDDRKLDGEELSVIISFDEFIQNYLQ